MDIAMVDLPPEVGAVLASFEPDVVFLSRQEDAVSSVLLVTGKEGSGGRQGQFVKMPSGIWLIEAWSRSDVDKLVAKFAGNAKSLQSLRKFLSYEVPRARLPNLRLRPLRTSRWVSRLAADILDLVIAAVGRLGIRGAGASAEYLSLEERKFLEKLATWQCVSDAGFLGDIERRLDGNFASFLLALLYLITLERFEEDIGGMAQTHLPLTVLGHAQAGAFLSLANAICNGMGAPVVSEPEVLDFTSTLRDERLTDLMLRGFFPNANDPDGHLRWLRNAIATERRSLMRSAALRLCVKQVSRLTPSDTRPPATSGGSISPRRGPVRDTAALRDVLKEYATSPEQLIAALPAVAEDDLILLGGSVAAGLGHQRSDLDVVVLCRSLPRLPGAKMSASAGHSQCLCGETALGQKIFAEYISDDLVAELVTWLNGLYSLILSPAGDATVLLGHAERLRRARTDPMISIADRTLRGITLRGNERPHQAPRQNSRTLCNAILCCSHLLESQVKLAVGVAHLGRSKDSLSLAHLRMATENLYMALLAAKGTPVTGKRWLIETLGRMDPKQLGPSSLAEMFFPQPSGVTAYARWLETHAAHIREQILSAEESASEWRDSLRLFFSKTSSAQEFPA